MSASTTTTTTTPDVGEVHVYDGIEEHDNRLPRWWLMTLWGAIVFAAGYWMFFQTFAIGVGPRAAFDSEMLARHQAEEALEHARGTVDDDDLVALSRDPAALERGRAVFTSTCQACHADRGQGLVGPNLTDSAWLHGNKPTQILAVVADGVVNQGMPAWKPALGADKVKDVAAFLLTLKGTNVAGKAPQGVVVVE
ncbi:MAG: cbb3-type cytochrome c oxidase N-terminal domain-containing protein [Deltaproteobacteria bacterium]|nr:cbb3-type cytochrome c oxidase N-terminal domain-containing protein [Deltaproteobacteria bacterium]